MSMSGFESSQATSGARDDGAYDKAVSRLLIAIGTTALVVAALASVMTAGG